MHCYANNALATVNYVLCKASCLIKIYQAEKANQMMRECYLCQSPLNPLTGDYHALYPIPRLADLPVPALQRQEAHHQRPGAFLFMGGKNSLPTCQGASSPQH
jgi:hypothetical protein